MYPTNTAQNVPLTKAGKMMIEMAIIQTKSLNRTSLLAYICDELTDKYSGEFLEYQAERMNFFTTGDILKAIDTYMYGQIKDGTVSIKPTQILRNKLAAMQSGQ